MDLRAAGNTHSMLAGSSVSVAVVIGRSSLDVFSVHSKSDLVVERLCVFQLVCRGMWDTCIILSVLNPIAGGLHLGAMRVAETSLV